MVDPTRPHPMITMCTAFLPARTMPAHGITLLRGGASPGDAPSRTPEATAREHGGVTLSERPAPAPGALASGALVELTVGEAAHGGWCVARLDPGPVIFVRHALPGEQVRAVITQTTAKLARADAVEILAASADRVTPPCPHPHPGGCGGCDWQHASLPAQRALKAAVVRQQLRRIAGLERDVTVESLPGSEDGLGWRTRGKVAGGTGGGAGPRPR